MKTIVLTQMEKEMDLHNKTLSLTTLINELKEYFNTNVETIEVEIQKAFDHYKNIKLNNPKAKIDIYDIRNYCYLNL